MKWFFCFLKMYSLKPVVNKIHCITWVYPRVKCTCGVENNQVGVRGGGERLL